MGAKVWDWGACTVRDMPHSPQNLNRGGFSKPHCGQQLWKGVPHSPQNFIPSGFSNPQIRQRMRTPPFYSPFSSLHSENILGCFCQSKRGPLLLFFLMIFMRPWALKTHGGLAKETAPFKKYAFIAKKEKWGLKTPFPGRRAGERGAR